MIGRVTDYVLDLVGIVVNVAAVVAFLCAGARPVRWLDAVDERMYTWLLRRSVRLHIRPGPRCGSPSTR